jgi:hypothetical protein
VESLRSTAAHPIEILVAVDPDDPTTKWTAISLGCVPVFATYRYGYGELYRYFNDMAEQSTGDWLVLWDDNSTIATPGWDNLLYELPPHILVGDFENHFSPSLCCFPAVRRNAVEAMGAYSLDTPHVDTVWEVIGRYLQAIAPIPAYIHHDRPDITGIPVDLTLEEGRQQHRSSDFHGPEFQGRLREAAERIRVECLEYL